jgi:hypothetical protein
MNVSLRHYDDDEITIDETTGHEYSIFSLYSMNIILLHTEDKEIVELNIQLDNPLPEGEHVTLPDVSDYINIATVVTPQEQQAQIRKSVRNQRAELQRLEYAEPLIPAFDRRIPIASPVYNATPAKDILRTKISQGDVTRIECPSELKKCTEKYCIISGGSLKRKSKKKSKRKIKKKSKRIVKKRK